MSGAKAQSEADAATSVKRPRRGVSNQTQLSRIKFHEKDAASNGLFVGHLDSVTVDWSKSDKMFNGASCPRLTFYFESNHANKNERRLVSKTLFPVGSDIDTIPGGKNAGQVDNVFQWIKHFLDIYYLKGRQLTEEEEDLLTLPFVDYDEHYQYIPVDVEEVLNGYATLFTNVAHIFNGDANLKDGEKAHPCYKTDNGGFIPVWIKLLRHYKTRDGWRDVANGDLAFSNYVGGGAIELQYPNKLPNVLRIDNSKESITPKETRKEPAFGGAGSQIPGMGGLIIDNPMNLGGGNDMNAFTEAGTNGMPF